MIRDATLSVAGTLNPQIGGRPVKIPIEPEVYNLIFTENERDGLVARQSRTKACRIAAAFISTTSAVCVCRCSPHSINPMRSPHAPSGRFPRMRCRLSRCSIATSCRKYRTPSRRRLEKCVRQASRLCRSIPRGIWRYRGRPAPKRNSSWPKSSCQSGGTLPEFCLALFNRNEFVYVP